MLVADVAGCPAAALCTLRAISCVAAPCSSTAAAMVAAMPSASLMIGDDPVDRGDRLPRRRLDLAHLRRRSPGSRGRSG